jgi:hypothetical protein
MDSIAGASISQGKTVRTTPTVLGVLRSWSRMINSKKHP